MTFTTIISMYLLIFSTINLVLTIICLIRLIIIMNAVIRFHLSDFSFIIVIKIINKIKTFIINENAVIE